MTPFGKCEWPEGVDSSLSTDSLSSAMSCRPDAHPVASSPSALQRFGSPESYTPKHLAERILTSKSALEGERKQVTVLFADLKGSMELLAERDPEEMMEQKRSLLRGEPHLRSATAGLTARRAQAEPARILHNDHTTGACAVNAFMRRRCEGAHRSPAYGRKNSPDTVMRT